MSARDSVKGIDYPMTVLVIPRPWDVVPEIGTMLGVMTTNPPLR